MAIRACGQAVAHPNSPRHLPSFLCLRALGAPAAVRTGVVLTVGGSTQVDLTMNLGTVSEVVTVRSEAPLIEPGRMDLSRVVTTTEIQSLPISGRNWPT